MTCARCEELREEVDWLKDQLGERNNFEARFTVARALRITPSAARVLLRLHGAGGHFVETWKLLDATSDPGHDDDRDPKIVSVQIWQLRRALGGKATILTSYGAGYQLSPPALARVSAILSGESVAA